MPSGANFTLREIEHLERALGNVDVRPTLAQPLAGLTLGALGELVCSGAFWAASGRHAEVELLDHWAAHHAPLRCAWNALQKPGQMPSAVSALGHFGVRPVPSKHELTGLPWQQFLESFGEGLIRHGFPRPLARALSGAFGEMADNVVSHSTPESLPPAPGIVAFHMEPGWMAYAVADTGRGVLASLVTSERWAHLRKAEQALRLAVTEGATRRSGFATGSGYQTVIQALSERNGYLRFRSDDAKLELRGSATTLQPRGGPVPPMPGLQLVVHCALEGSLPGERQLPAVL